MNSVLQLCGRIHREAATRLGIGLLALAVFAVSVEAIGLAVVRARGHDSQPRLGYYLHGFVATIEGAPPLARWDSIWYYAVATEGYTGHGPDSRLTPGFLPLYPIFMRALGDVSGCGYFTAGVCVSRLALLCVVLLLPIYAREREGQAEPGWAVVVTLLAFPSAYILVAVYAEAMFVALALAAFVLARRRSHGWAALAAFGAALTRIHGLALIPALAVLGWEQWRRGGPPAAALAETTDGKRYGRLETYHAARHAHSGTFLPAIGAASAYLALVGYFWIALGNPLAHLAAKYQGWHQKFTPPWTTLGGAIDRLDHSLAHPGLGTVYTALELPCLYLIGATVALLCVRRWWPEAVYVACAAAMSLCCGTLDGVPRYTIALFPVFVVLSGLRRWPMLWGLYLVTGVVLQVCLLVHFVRFASPPP
ncbi:MAG TPA: hypothetical protein VND64_25760 [Pirellulales bacterium]|nr:hypothetical protein [Pirellulales bacterium]